MAYQTINLADFFAGGRPAAVKKSRRRLFFQPAHTDLAGRHTSIESLTKERMALTIGGFCGHEITCVPPHPRSRSFS
jgi:hypothetical protein